MIGNFYPALVYVQSGFIGGPSYNTVCVAATTSATELSNDFIWIKSANN